MCITRTFFQLGIISNWGLRVIHYNKKNHVFSPLKISRIDSKKVTCSEWVGVFSYKLAKVLSFINNFIIIPFKLLMIKKKHGFNFDTKSVFVIQNSYFVDQ